MEKGRGTRATNVSAVLHELGAVRTSESGGEISMQVMDRFELTLINHIAATQIHAYHAEQPTNREQ